mmetsp:Transcript_16828/g.45549  ORF Transcript_16828/g.45549 Transcript_16828/m.45549 type:complete len:247 (+) Transcript_16828:817-1557(+)
MSAQWRPLTPHAKLSHKRALCPTRGNDAFALPAESRRPLRTPRLCAAAGCAVHHAAPSRSPIPSRTLLSRKRSPSPVLPRHRSPCPSSRTPHAGSRSEASVSPPSPKLRRASPCPSPSSRPTLQQTDSILFSEQGAVSILPHKWHTLAATLTPRQASHDSARSPRTQSTRTLDSGASVESAASREKRRRVDTLWQRTTSPLSMRSSFAYSLVAPGSQAEASVFQDLQLKHKRQYLEHHHTNVARDY